MNRPPHGAAALACVTLFLTACGGGDQPQVQSSAASNDRATTSAIVATTSDDHIITVSLASGSAGNQIVVRNKFNFLTVKLYKNNGTEVTSLDDLPEGIANYTWVTAPPAKGHLRIRFRPSASTPFRFNTGWVWPTAASGHDSSRQIVLEKDPSVTAELAFLGSVGVSGAYSASTGKVTLTTNFSKPYEQLWAENGRAIRARTPNAGSYYYIKDAAHGWPASPGGTVVTQLNDAPVNKQAFQAHDNAYPTLSAIKSTNDANAVVVLMDSWQVTKHRVADIDEVGKRVRLSPPAIWELAKYSATGQRYFVENTASALDAPGEWYAAGNTLSYKPVSAANGATVKFEVPQVEKLLVMNGSLANGKWVQYVQFSGLKFRYAKADMPSTGYIDGQADTSVSAAIELNEARFIEFANCEVSRTGGYGIWLNNKVRNVTINGSELFDLGAGGIKIGKSRPAEVFPIDWSDYQDPNATGNNTFTGNRIHSTGHVYPGAVGVWIGRSDFNMVYDNLIKDTTYSGISVGWKWDGGPTMARFNTIANNFLDNIGQESLADMGGIYLLGRAPGTWVQNNVIKKVTAYDGYTGGGRGIYADEGSSDLIVQNNIVLGANGAGYFQHRGDGNVLRDNVFADVDFGFTVAKRLVDNGVASTVTPLTLQSNLFLPRNNALVELSADATLMTGTATPTPAWVAPAPQFFGNVVAPQFLNGAPLVIPTSLCINCTPNQSLTVSDPGALRVPTVSGRTYTEGVNIARSWHTATLSSSVSASRLWAGNKPEIPAKMIDFRANQWPLGATALTGWQVIAQPQYVSEPNPPEPMSFLQDADGTTFLAMADAQRSGNGWEPYIQNWVKYASGTAEVSFTVRFDANTNLQHSWRADDSGIKTGPSVSFVARATSPTTSVVDVFVKGVWLRDVPTGQWVTFKVSSPIAANANWTLSVTPPGGYPASDHANLTPVNQDWSYLGPVLFASLANVRTTTAIKTISVKKL